MRATAEQLERALDHTPAMAFLVADRPDQAMHVGAACIAGGFRVLGVHGSIPDADDLVAALTPRPDTIVGLVHPVSPDQVTASVTAGAAFILGSNQAEELKEASATALWIPGMSTTDPLDLALTSSDTWLHLCCHGNLDESLERLKALSDRYPERYIIASGGVPGDRIGSWISAGARAVGLREALYSPTLVAEGASVTIRNHAAAVHREATRHSRISKRL
ncbi:MAG: hypothetical protein VYE15_03250 [Myxococcota bacterium]|nr:hypothetical protein [Myxococcota bacterium]